MGAWYRTGSVTVTNGSATVQGHNTAWETQVDMGDLFSIDGEKFYEVEVVVDDTELTLRTNYAEATQSEIDYFIIRNFTSTVPASLAARITTLLNKWHTREDELYAWHEGVVDGGPNNDGKYPFTTPVGGTILIACPAKLEAMASVFDEDAPRNFTDEITFQEPPVRNLSDGASLWDYEFPSAGHSTHQVIKIAALNDDTVILRGRISGNRAISSSNSNNIIIDVTFGDIPSFDAKFWLGRSPMTGRIVTFTHESIIYYGLEITGVTWSYPNNWYFTGTYHGTLYLEAIDLTEVSNVQEYNCNESHSIYCGNVDFKKRPTVDGEDLVLESEIPDLSDYVTETELANELGNYLQDNDPTVIQSIESKGIHLKDSAFRSQFIIERTGSYASTWNFSLGFGHLSIDTEDKQYALVLSKEGNLGINAGGNSTGPKQRLHIDGHQLLQGRLIAGNSLGHANIGNALDYNKTAGVDAFRPINLIDTASVIKVARNHNSSGAAVELIQWDANIENVLSRSMIAAEDDKLRVININNGDINLETTGNVGIGTTSPASKLHVNGVARLDNRLIVQRPLDTDGNQAISFNVHRNFSIRRRGASAPTAHLALSSHVSGNPWAVWHNDDEIVNFGTGGDVEFSKNVKINGEDVLTGDALEDHINASNPPDHGQLYVGDCREPDDFPGSDTSNAYTPDPNDNFLNKAITPIFGQGWEGPNWGGGFICKGWAGDYAAWQLMSNADTSTTDELYYRNGAGSSWNDWHRISMCESYAAGSTVIFYLLEEEYLLDETDGLDWMPYDPGMRSPSATHKGRSLACRVFAPGRVRCHVSHARHSGTGNSIVGILKNGALQGATNSTNATWATITRDFDVDIGDIITFRHKFDGGSATVAKWKEVRVQANKYVPLAIGI